MEVQTKKHVSDFEHNPTDCYDWENIKIKVSPLRRDPSFNDDHTKGYNIFSLIANTSVSPRRIFICVSPEEHNAIWRDITSRSTGTIEDAYFKSVDTMDSLRDGLQYKLTENNFTNEYKALVSSLISNGTGFKYLADDGTYKNVQGFSGKYEDLSGTPTIPTKMSELVQDVSYVNDPDYVQTENNFSEELKTKVIGIADNATKNKEDNHLLDRSNHTGSQLAETISDFDEAVSNNQDVIESKAKSHSHENQSALSAITSSGGGGKFLADDGLYKEVAGGTGESFLYTNLVPTPVTIGGWPAGSTFDALSIKQMLDGLFYPYVYPFFASFGISGQSQTIEAGSATTTTPLFTWGITNAQNLNPNSIRIINVTSGAVIESGLPNTGSKQSAIAGISNESPATVTFRAIAENTKLGTFTKDFSISWQSNG